MSKQITISGGNLYAVAADEYGNAMGWVQIAQANGLTDPQITSTITLIIPEFNGDVSGIWRE